MKLELITLGGVKMDEEVYEVLIPTESGRIAVYPGHERLVTLAIPGVVQVLRQPNALDEEIFVINGGIVEVNPQVIRILVDEAENAEEIVAAEAEAAIERAKQHLAAAKDQITVNEAQAMLNRHTVRLKVATLRRKRRIGSLPRE